MSPSSSSFRLISGETVTDSGFWRSLAVFRRPRVSQDELPAHAMNALSRIIQMDSHPDLPDEHRLRGIVAYESRRVLSARTLRSGRVHMYAVPTGRGSIAVVWGEHVCVVPSLVSGFSLYETVCVDESRIVACGVIDDGTRRVEISVGGVWYAPTIGENAFFFERKLPEADARITCIRLVNSAGVETVANV